MVLLHVSCVCHHLECFLHGWLTQSKPDFDRNASCCCLSLLDSSAVFLYPCCFRLVCTNVCLSEVCRCAGLDQHSLLVQWVAKLGTASYLTQKSLAGHEEQVELTLCLVLRHKYPVFFFSKLQPAQCGMCRDGIFRKRTEATFCIFRKKATPRS